MWKSIVGAVVFALGLSGAAMAQEQIRISSDWGDVTATLADNEAAEALLEMLPLTRECLKLCVSDRAHAVFRYVQASKRPVNIMAS